MRPKICSKCQKNIAVIFIAKIENGETKNEGLCLKCAREMGLKPIDDIIKNMGLTEEDLDNLTNDMTEMLQNEEGLMALNASEIDEDEEDTEGKTATFPFLNKLFGASERREEAPKQENNRKKKRKFLENYCISLTGKARANAIDRIVGREREIERVIQILNRRQKNNPCLIGEPGVGKTAIAEGLAMKIVEGDVPYKLLNKELYLLDMTALVAGTQFRGQFESRMKGLIDEIKKDGNIILMIDEVHSIVGAGDSEGSMNAANILKPALSRGEVQVIGATTFTEYRKHIEKDSALERRFQPVTVLEPTIEDSVKIIKGIAHYYEEFHGVKIPEGISRQAVLFSERYVTDRYLPDKAIDLIDEAASEVNLHNQNFARMETIKQALADYDRERELLMEENSENNFEKLAMLRSKELQAREELNRLKQMPLPEITVEHLAKVIEQWTKIPASKIEQQEYERLAKLEDRIKERLVGQDEAVAAVAAAIRRNRVGISPKRKPVSFIFTGSTGVGKTELVKLVAQDLFDSQDALIRLDMSEFMEKHSVSRMIGSPPGYVGYDDAGQLTEKVRRNPYCVVLFDEIEKAHPDVLNVLLQVLDDGHITDAQGRKVNFENTVIVMTTNAGSDKKNGYVGFVRSINEQSREKTLKALNDFLRPEFINRVDEVVCFNKLSEENFKKIAAIMMEELKTSLGEKEITLRYSDAVLDYLTKKSYSMEYGARNLRRTIQKEIEDSVATQIINRYETPVTQVEVDVLEDKLDIKTM